MGIKEKPSKNHLVGLLLHGMYSMWLICSLAHLTWEHASPHWYMCTCGTWVFWKTAFWVVVVGWFLMKSLRINIELSLGSAQSGKSRNLFMMMHHPTMIYCTVAIESSQRLKWPPPVQGTVLAHAYAGCIIPHNNTDLVGFLLDFQYDFDWGNITQYVYRHEEHCKTNTI